MKPCKAEPLVSVIMPFLNPGPYFEEAIESVRRQDWQDWELILVDDGSTDGSERIAREFVHRDPQRIRLAPPGPPAGASEARNRGIAVARGSLLALLDADDVWLHDKLASQVAILDKHPLAAMVNGATRMWHSWRPDAGEEDRVCFLGVAPDRLYEPPQLVERFLKGRAETPGTCSVLMRRCAVEAVGAFHADFPGMFDDQVLFYKLCLRYPVYVESAVRDFYRQHERSTCHSAARAGLYDPNRPNRAQERFLRWFETYLAGHGGENEAVRRALDRALAPYRRPLARRCAQVGRALFPRGTGSVIQRVRRRALHALKIEATDHG